MPRLKVLLITMMWLPVIWTGCAADEEDDCVADCENLSKLADDFEDANADPSADLWVYETNCFATSGEDETIDQWCAYLDDYYNCLENCSSS